MTLMIDDWDLLSAAQKEKVLRLLFPDSKDIYVFIRQDRLHIYYTRRGIEYETNISAYTGYESRIKNDLQINEHKSTTD